MPSLSDNNVANIRDALRILVVLGYPEMGASQDPNKFRFKILHRVPVQSLRALKTL